MFSIITTEGKKEHIRNAIGETPAFEKTGVFDSESTRLLFHNILRTPCDVLIVDINIGPDDDIVTGLRDFKIARPETRSIVISTNREPGDVTIAQIISLGIYDIIFLQCDQDSECSVLQEKLKEKLNASPANYSDVARWHVLNGLGVSSKDKEVIYKDRIIGTTYIAVGAAYHGAGATHMTFALSKFLAEEGFKVATIELGDKMYSCFSVLPKMYETEKKNEICFSFQGIDFYKDVLLKDMQKTEASYEYYVLDLGTLKKTVKGGGFEKSENIEEMQRSPFPVLVASGGFWRLIKDLAIYKDYLKGNWNLFFNHVGDDDDLQYFIQELIGDKSNTVPYIPNPFNISDRNKEFFREALKPILPEEKPKRKKRFLFL